MKLANLFVVFRGKGAVDCCGKNIKFRYDVDGANFIKSHYSREFAISSIFRLTPPVPAHDTQGKLIRYDSKTTILNRLR